MEAGLSKAETLSPKVMAELWSAAEHANMYVSQSQGVTDINRQIQQGQSLMTETTATVEGPEAKHWRTHFP